jgi:hypothetical protein
MMGNQHAPYNGRLVRFTRGRRFDDNPLRRRSDRAETVILAGMFVALLAGGPAAMLAGGGVAHDLAWHARLSQMARERYVTAVTTQTAPPPDASRDLGMMTYPVLAHWTAPDGRPTTGEIPVALPTSAGTHEQVWVTLNGKLGAQPLQDSQITSLTTLGEVASLVTLVAVLAIATGLARHELDRRRFAAWEADWRAIDPRTQHK